MAKSISGEIRIPVSIRLENLNLVTADTRISAADRQLVDERLNGTLRQRIKDVLTAGDDDISKKIDAVSFIVVIWPAAS